MQGLDLDFLFGRGYLSAAHLRIGDWATIESLRMEIPDLSFPFDARGGIGRFRHTRCHLRDIVLTLSESGLDRAIRTAVGEIDGFEEAQVRFLDGAVLVTLRLKTLGSDTFITFRAAAIVPELHQSDELHVVLHDVRSYGPLPYPGRMLVANLVEQLLTSSIFTTVGTGPHFAVHHRGDLVTLCPIRLALMATFPDSGWKIPSLYGLRYDSIDIHPGGLTIAARTVVDLDAHRPDPRVAASATASGARAIAAYEARDLLRDADNAMFGGSPAQAVEILRSVKDRYGLHPAIAEAILDALLATPGAGHLAEASSMVDELLRGDPGSLRAHLAAPTVALLRGDTTTAVEAYDRLASLLRRRGETRDLMASQLAAAMILRRTDRRAAIRLLSDVVSISPRNRNALELLAAIYEDEDDVEGLIDVLTRLAPLCTEREVLLVTYQRLAELLMERRGDLSAARVNLERILRLDPTNLDALEKLGQSFALAGQPLRAIKTFGNAGRHAEESGQPERAAALHLRCARIWQELDDLPSALVSCERAIDANGEDPAALEMGVQLAAASGNVVRALALIDQLVPLVEAAAETAEDRSQARHSARRVHLLAADLADQRGRRDTAAAHHRRALGYRDVFAGDDPSLSYLENYYAAMGRPQELIDLLLAEVDSLGETETVSAARYHRKLARLYEQHLGLATEAAHQLSQALERQPDDVEAIDELVVLLANRGQWLDLVGRLDDLQPNVTTRQARARVLLHLGRVRVEALPDPVEAVRLLREAQRQLPSDPAIARTLATAEVALLDDHDAHAGDTTAAVFALERLAEVSPEPGERAEALRRAGDLTAQRLGREQDAAALYARAEKAAAEDARPVPTPSSPAPERPQPAVAQPTPGPASRLDLFRESLQESVKRPATLEQSLPSLQQLRSSVHSTATTEVTVDEVPLRTDKLASSVHSSATTEVSHSDTVPRQDVLARLHDANNLDGAERETRLREILETRLSDDMTARVSRELGLHLYYEAERPDEAARLLDDAVDLDPEGAGRDFDVLTALEGIAEDLDQPERLLAVYRAKQAIASDDNMRAVYGTLIGELLWEKLGRPDEAVVALEDVLDQGGDHEPALRLLADIATARGDLAGAAKSLRRIVAEHESGSFELTEGLRRLGHTLAAAARDDEDNRDALRSEAIDTYQQLLDEVPGDAEAFGALKTLYAETEDHESGLSLLGLELGILVGQPNAFPEGPTADGLSSLELSEALSIPASQIVADAAQLCARDGKTTRALQLYEAALKTWEHNIDALTSRLELLRQQGDLAAYAELAVGLEKLAALMLDPGDQFAALYEAAEISATQLGDVVAAQRLVAEALPLAEVMGSDHPSRDNVEAARTLFESLEGADSPATLILPSVDDLEDDDNLGRSDELSKSTRSVKEKED